MVNDSSVSESRREERLLQLLRMLNMFLEKRKVSFPMHMQPFMKRFLGDMQKTSGVHYTSGGTSVTSNEISRSM